MSCTAITTTKRKPLTLIVRLLKRGFVVGIMSVTALSVFVLVLMPRGPLPPPKVALNLTGFITRSNNVLVLMSITNAGQTEICLWHSSQLWKAEIETQTGWLTNNAPFASVVGEIIPATSNRIFAVPLPVDTIQWRITTIYGYSKRHHVSSELYDRIWSSRLVQRGPKPIADAISWCLDLLPEAPPLSEGEISTLFLTNWPPSEIDAAK
jgi:hypothetical protein